jgi:GNAT superfamily N-acetyltransferase
MNDLTIREAAEEDIPAILALYSAASIGDGENFTVDEALLHLTSLSQYPSFRVFVALVDRTIVGTYELLIMDNMAKRGKRSGIVEDVAVDPHTQGQGIGRAMMQHALEQCRQAECYKLTLSSNLKRDDAHRFYDALDFKRHGYSFQIEM